MSAQVFTRQLILILLVWAGSLAVTVVAFADEPKSEAESDKVPADLGAVKETTNILSGTELVSDDFAGSWPMFGNDVRMKIGGYVKADFVVDLSVSLG